uniref:Uncharacterized protein n=1 Tax=Glossina palpalis gambiensis TaxID=67801 RepID=A0A1B0AQC9_9MUSC
MLVNDIRCACIATNMPSKVSVHSMLSCTNLKGANAWRCASSAVQQCKHCGYKKAIAGTFIISDICDSYRQAMASSMSNNLPTALTLYSSGPLALSQALNQTDLANGGLMLTSAVCHVNPYLPSGEDWSEYPSPDMSRGVANRIVSEDKDSAWPSIIGGFTVLKLKSSFTNKSQTNGTQVQISSSNLRVTGMDSAVPNLLIVIAAWESAFQSRLAATTSVEKLKDYIKAKLPVCDFSKINISKFVFLQPGNITSFKKPVPTNLCHIMDKWYWFEGCFVRDFVPCRRSRPVTNLNQLDSVSKS